MANSKPYLFVGGPLHGKYREVEDTDTTFTVLSVGIPASATEGTEPIYTQTTYYRRRVHSTDYSKAVTVYVLGGITEQTMWGMFSRLVVDEWIAEQDAA